MLGGSSCKKTEMSGLADRFVQLQNRRGLKSASNTRLHRIIHRTAKAPQSAIAALWGNNAGFISPHRQSTPGGFSAAQAAFLTGYLEGLSIKQHRTKNSPCPREPARAAEVFPPAVRKVEPVCE